MAQLGSAPRLGRGGRTFKSCHPDHLLKLDSSQAFLLDDPITSCHHTRHSNFIRMAVSCIRFRNAQLTVSLTESLSYRPFINKGFRGFLKPLFFCIFFIFRLIFDWHYQILQIRQFWTFVIFIHLHNIVRQFSACAKCIKAFRNKFFRICLCIPGNYSRRFLFFKVRFE